MGASDSLSTIISTTTMIIKEDWGGDGRGRMNLSGRSTAISSAHIPRKYYYFDTNKISETEWRINGLPENVISGKRCLLSWHECGASTARVTLPSNFEAPSGIFTADLEIFILKGTIKIGEWQLNKHCYSFIPAGVLIGDWKVVGNEEVEILWMENGSVPFEYKEAKNNYPDANLSQFIPILDSKLLPWGKPDTVQFVQANKKWLRKDSNGGGVWLLAVLPHYDGKYQMIQSYNEEGYGLAGSVDIGNDCIAKDFFAYTPSFSTVPVHKSEGGGLFFIRIDRDLSQMGTVLSYAG